MYEQKYERQGTKQKIAPSEEGAATSQTVIKLLQERHPEPRREVVREL